MIERPLILNPRNRKDRRILARLRRTRGIRVVDTIAEQYAELFVIDHPRLITLAKQQLREAISAFIKQISRKVRLEHRGRWVYLPWQHAVCHVLEERSFFKIRTNRNADLITAEEQKKFYDCVVGIAGLSVGSSIALTLVLQGGAKRIRIADFDSLELTNTNRMLAGIHELSLPKTTIVSRRIWEMNPYTQIQIFPDGLDAHTAGRFMDGLDVVVDEMDSMVVKQMIREHARSSRVALISAADDGDTSVIDIERHDRRRTAYFLGRLGTTNTNRFRSLDKILIIKEITRLIGPENVPVRMQASLRQIGKRLVSVPQLGGTALVGAAAVAYCIHRIAAGLSLPSGRAIISLDEKLLPGYASGIRRAFRKRSSRIFAKRFGL